MWYNNRIFEGTCNSGVVGSGSLKSHNDVSVQGYYHIRIL
jgi:hypothetical protein